MKHDHVEQGPAGHVRGRQFRAYNIAVVLAMAFASIAMGWSASIIATTLGSHRSICACVDKADNHATEQPSFIAYFELATRPDATNLIGAMNGLFQAGAFFGALCISWVADRFGRKMAITVPAILVVISGALLSGSVNIGMFITFRFFSGMGSFWLLGSIPVWVSHCRMHNLL